MLTGNLAQPSPSLHIEIASLSSELVMTNRLTRLLAGMRHAMLHRGLVALLLPLGLLFLAFVARG
jgi:hypothetical protein